MYQFLVIAYLLLDNENWKIIPDSRIRNIVYKGPNYRFPSHIDFNKCRKEIVSALNDFCNRWSKPESVECNAIKQQKLSIFNKVDKRESTKTPGIHEHRGNLSGLKLLPFAEGSENLASIYLENVS